jgi:predicted glycosyltransferase
MAGYNTTVEILRSKKSAVLIPRSGPSAEQRTRTRLFSARQWVEGINPDELTPVLLADRILKSLEHPPKWRARNRPDLHGLLVSVYHLLALLYADQDAESIPVAWRSTVEHSV